MSGLHRAPRAFNKKKGGEGGVPHVLYRKFQAKDDDEPKGQEQDKPAKRLDILTIDPAIEASPHPTSRLGDGTTAPGDGLGGMIGSAECGNSTCPMSSPSQSTHQPEWKIEELGFREYF
jgi:hypothetical protein